MTQWILLILAFIALFVLVIYYTRHLKKIYNKDQQDFYKANYADKQTDEKTPK